MDSMDADMDYYGADGYSDYTHESPRRRYRSPAYRYKRSAGMTRMDTDMDYYGYDGYPDYRKYRQTRKPRPSLGHHRRHKRSAGLTRSQAKKYRMSPEARFRRMLSAAGQKRRKNNHMRVKKYYYM